MVFLSETKTKSLIDHVYVCLEAILNIILSLLKQLQIVRFCEVNHNSFTKSEHLNQLNG